MVGSLAALIYQHSMTPMSLPCKLVLPVLGESFMCSFIDDLQFYIQQRRNIIQLRKKQSFWHALPYCTRLENITLINSHPCTCWSLVIMIFCMWFIFLFDFVHVHCVSLKRWRYICNHNSGTSWLSCLVLSVSAVWTGHKSALQKLCVIFTR